MKKCFFERFLVKAKKHKTVYTQVFIFMFIELFKKKFQKTTAEVLQLFRMNFNLFLLMQSMLFSLELAQLTLEMIFEPILLLLFSRLQAR